MRYKEILKKIKSFGSDHLPTFGGDFEGGIHLQQVPEEISILIEKLLYDGYKNINLLEVGSASGGMVYVLNYFLGIKKAVIIDDNKHKKHSLRQEILKDINTCEYIGDSHSKEAVGFAEVNTPTQGYDIIVIDGDHSYDGVAKDYINYMTYVNLSGLIIFHDIIVCPGVKKFTDKLKNMKTINIYMESVNKGDKKLGLLAIHLC